MIKMIKIFSFFKKKKPKPKEEMNQEEVKQEEKPEKHLDVLDTALSDIDTEIETLHRAISKDAYGSLTLEELLSIIESNLNKNDVLMKFRAMYKLSDRTTNTYTLNNAANIHISISSKRDYIYLFKINSMFDTVADQDRLYVDFSNIGDEDRIKIINHIDAQLYKIARNLGEYRTQINELKSTKSIILEFTSIMGGLKNGKNK